MAKISINLKDGTAKQEDPLIVGIDLGTTNSLVAYMKDGKPEAIKGKWANLIMTFPRSPNISATR